MKAQQEIEDAQKKWAQSQNIPYCPSGYVDKVEVNLWQPLSTRAKCGFAKGAGSELEGNMKALHSSSALVVNLFDYWTEKPKDPILAALGIESTPGYSLDFEKQFPTGLRGTPPHLDVVFTNQAGSVVAIESKFTEHLSRSTKGKSNFTQSYFPEGCCLWAEKGLPACQELAEELRISKSCCNGQPFEYLDPWQLLKHALGLAKANSDNDFKLCYLYYDWPCKESERHRQEIRIFCERVGNEIQFTSLTHREVFVRLKNFEQVRSDYLDYLETRYFGHQV